MIFVILKAKTPTMIKPETIDKIFDSARIEEVVGDFVTLKRRGVNMLGSQRENTIFYRITGQGYF